jgi:hypothetical protein
MLPFLEKLVVKQTRVDHPEPFASASSITYVNSDAPPFLSCTAATTHSFP